MQTSRKKLPAPMRAILAAVVFGIAVIAVTFVITAPFNRMAPDHIAADYGTLYVGSSRMAVAANLELIDDALGTCSVKKATPGATVYSRDAIIRSTLGVYDIDRVIIEITPTNLSEEPGVWVPDVVIYELPYLETLHDKLSYLKHHQSLGRLMMTYGTWLYYGFEAWNLTIHGEPVARWLTHGTERKDPADQTIPKDEIPARRLSREWSTEYDPGTLQSIRDMIRHCQELGAEPVLVATPVSEQCLWEYSGWEEFGQEMKRLSEETGCAFYDFNLYKERQAFFRDEDSFVDYEHLSAKGQDAFSGLFAEILQRAETEDISTLFYETYEEAVDHCVYAQ